jgi:hypothetical protein
MSDLKVVYAGMSDDLLAPGDRRRFAGFAMRNGVDLFKPSSGVRGADAVVLTLGSDISQWKELKKAHGVLILDIVDSYLDESFLSMKAILRGAYKSINGDFKNSRLSYRKLLREVISNADAVVCASLEQRQALNIFNPNVHAVLDCFEELFQPDIYAATSHQSDEILWEGYPENLKHFKILSQKGSPIAAGQAFKLVTSTSTRRYFRTISTEALSKRIGFSGNVVPWSISNLIEAANSCSYGIIPINRSDGMAWNKSENKLLGLWALGIPVLVSPSPSYSRVAKQAGNAHCLISEGDWSDSLRAASTDIKPWTDSLNLAYAYAKNAVSSSTVDLLWSNALASVNLTTDRPKP